MVCYLWEEGLRILQNVLEFCQFQKVPHESFLVGVHLLQLILKLLKAGLDVTKDTISPK